MLTECSNTLFAHYLEETGGLLSTLPPGSNNPFLSLIVPLCSNDDLLLHSLLALSGAHLSFRDTGIEIYVAMCRHYSIAIRTLRVAVGDLEGDDEPRILRILLALMILSFCEVCRRNVPAPHMKKADLSMQTLSGNTQAAMFFHLRASRRLILQLMESPLHSRPDDSGHLFRFILEIHCYFVLINNITPFGAIESRTLPYDPFLDFVNKNCFDASGAIFNGSHGLFEILPTIAVLSARRLTEGESLDHAVDNAELYMALQNRIVNWTPPPAISSDKKWEAQRETALELCREATLLYLEISMSGSEIDNPDVQDKVQNHIDVIMAYADLAAGSPFETILLWPIMIAGSCMVRSDQRQQLYSTLRSTRFRMQHCVQAAEILEGVWNDPGEQIFGPYGMTIIMQKRGINFGVA